MISGCQTLHLVSSSSEVNIITGSPVSSPADVATRVCNRHGHCDWSSNNYLAWLPSFGLYQWNVNRCSNRLHCDGFQPHNSFCCCLLSVYQSHVLNSLDKKKLNEENFIVNIIIVIIINDWNIFETFEVTFNGIISSSFFKQNWRTRGERWLDRHTLIRQKTIQMLSHFCRLKNACQKNMKFD